MARAASRRIFVGMDLVHTTDDRSTHPFAERAASRRSQGGTMALAPGETTRAGNTHPGDQWVFVVEGDGEVEVEGQRHPLAAGDLLLIEAGEQHQIRNTGEGVLRTVNVYAPPSIDPNNP